MILVDIAAWCCVNAHDRIFSVTPASLLRFSTGLMLGICRHASLPSLIPSLLAS